MRRGQSRKFAKELGIRLGEWNWGDGEKGKYLQIVYLFSWQELYLFFATQFLYIVLAILELTIEQVDIEFTENCLSLPLEF